jgi:hypothetical protein
MIRDQSVIDLDESRIISHDVAKLHQNSDLIVSQSSQKKKGLLGSGLKRFFKKVIKSNKKESHSPIKQDRQRNSRLNSQIMGDE